MSKEVGKAIKRRRNEIGLSQKDFAAIAMVSRGTVKNAEAGSTRMERPTLRRLERALGWFDEGIDDIEVVDHGLKGGPAVLLPREVLSAQSMAAITGIILIRDDRVITPVEGDKEALHSFMEAFSRDRLHAAVIEEFVGKLLNYVSAEDETRIIEELEAGATPEGKAQLNRVLAKRRTAEPGSALTTLDLPISLENTLSGGTLRDWLSVPSPEGTLNVVVMAIADAGKEPSERDRDHWIRLMRAIESREPEPPPEKD